MDELLKLMLMKSMHDELIKPDEKIDAKHLEYCPWLDQKTYQRSRANVKKAIIWNLAEAKAIAGATYQDKRFNCFTDTVDIIAKEASEDVDFDKALEVVASKMLEIFPCQ